MTVQRGAERLDRGEARTLGQQMGLLERELDTIEEALGRVPTRTELTVFAGMWSEHCSYKSTLHLLKHLPKEGERVLAGPGGHAGTVDVGDGWAVAFKIESHNHPSAVEPYEGAATGVGGILRDIIAQGARPCAVMDSLCFGLPDDPNNRRLEEGVVAGIAGYGNAFGVPNIGGRTYYDPGYDGNPLVNALAAGMVRTDAMRTGKARGIGNALVYVGATTGRDGILGAAFASEELAEDTVEDRPHVQVGDPFNGKRLMEACMAFDGTMGLVACQDMGASGITCSAVEMAALGNVGIEVDLETIPLREADLAPQEIMLSESQERFMFVVEKGRENAAVDHFRRMGVHAVICGRVVEGDRVRVLYKGDTVVDVPAALVADGTPPTDWPVADSLPDVPPYPTFDESRDLRDDLLGLLADPCIADKAPLTSRYDGTVGNRTVRGSDRAEAGVLKLPDSRRGFALTITSRGDLCAADPYLGTQSILAAAMRNLACAGAEMVAITDGLNMASPRDPVENLKLYQVIRGLEDGLTALGVPVTGGNVSLYNESPKGPIPPTPMVGALGIVEDIERIPNPGFGADEVIFWLGSPDAVPVTSRFGRLKTGEAVGEPPEVRMEAEKLLAGLLVEQIRAGRVRAAKDGGQGGVGVALAKLCLRGGVGAQVEIHPTHRADWWLFGEYPATAVVSVASADAETFEAAAHGAGVPAMRAGTTGGDHLKVQGHLGVSLDDLRDAFRNWRDR